MRGKPWLTSVPGHPVVWCCFWMLGPSSRKSLVICLRIRSFPWDENHLSLPFVWRCFNISKSSKSNVSGLRCCFYICIFVCLSYRKSPSSRTIILSQVLVLICLRWLGKYGLVQLPTSFLLTFFDCCNSRAQLSDIANFKPMVKTPKRSGSMWCPKPARSILCWNSKARVQWSFCRHVTTCSASSAMASLLGTGLLWKNVNLRTWPCRMRAK